MHRYNYLEHAQIDAWANEMQACQAGGGSCGHINEKFEKLSIAQQEKLISVCAADATACQQQFGSVVADSLLVKQSIDKALGQDIPLKMVYDLSALRLHQSDAEGAVLSAQFAKDLSEKYGLDADTVTLAAGLLASAVTGLPIKGPKGGTGTSNVKESSGAENVVNLGALHSQLLAEEVSRGHAYQKHVVERKEFVDLGVTTQRQFQTFVESIVSNPSIDRRQSVDGTTYYLDHSTKTIVIRGQRGEATAFRPDQGGMGWDNYIKSQVPKK